MKRIGIIGVGSPFGEDNIALTIIEKIKRKPLEKNVICKYYDRPGLHLLECIKTFNTVHLVDAVFAGNRIGTIYRFDEIDQFKKNTKPLSTHSFGLAEILTLGESLNLLPEKLIIHGIEITTEQQFDLNLGETLSKTSAKLANKIFAEL